MLSMNMVPFQISTIPSNLFVIFQKAIFNKHKKFEIIEKYQFIEMF